jgi:hypothetical protein
VRASHPTLVVVGRALQEQRATMVGQWAAWITERTAAPHKAPCPLLERELRLLFDILVASLGPMRRECSDVWIHACEHYGRSGAARGLAAGEIVEEMQHLRELLIRRIGPVLAGLRPRQAMSIILRLNAVLDKGIAVAVVGYTDALVATLFAQNGVPAPSTDPDHHDLDRQLDAIEGELAVVVGHR